MSASGPKRPLGPQSPRLGRGGLHLRLCLCYSRQTALPPQTSPMSKPDENFMLHLREALEASWDRETAYLGASQTGNPALGQCYPTSRVVQHYYPATEIVKGIVGARGSDEVHFWNGLPVGDDWYHLDLSWQQFPAGSVIKEFSILDRNNLGDSDATVQRCALLLRRVEEHLRRSAPSDRLRPLSSSPTVSNGRGCASVSFWRNADACTPAEQVPLKPEP